MFVREPKGLTSDAANPALCCKLSKYGDVNSQSAGFLVKWTQVATPAALRATALHDRTTSWQILILA